MRGRRRRTLSFQASANSLPAEVRSRLALSAKLVESAIKAPGAPVVFNIQEVSPLLGGKYSHRHFPQERHLPQEIPPPHLGDPSSVFQTMTDLFGQNRWLRKQLLKAWGQEEEQVVRTVPSPDEDEEDADTQESYLQRSLHRQRFELQERGLPSGGMAAGRNAWLREAARILARSQGIQE